MTALNIGREAQQAIVLIKSFSLELNQYSPESQVLYWLNRYRAAWIRDAIIEAVYQGRYKIISVQHILQIWHRRGEPVRHFTSGFEQVIASHLGAPIHLSIDIASPPRPEVSAPRILPFPRQDAHPEMSEAFPIRDGNSLVEIYQASEPRQTAPLRLVPEKQIAPTQMTPTLRRANTPNKGISFEVPQPAEDRQTLLEQSKVYATPVGSTPIQPFRPSLRRQSATL